MREPMTQFPRDMILEAIPEDGATAAEIVAAVGIKPSTLSVRLLNYRERGHLYIDRWVPGARGHTVAVYQRGRLNDVPRPT